MMRLLSLPAAFAVLLLAGCSETPEVSYYLLPEPERRPAPSATFAGGTVAVREIAMPLYARAQQIASLSPDGSVRLDDDHRWADEPSRAATLHLVEVLEGSLGVPVVAEPWPLSVKPARRVDVTVDRFIGPLGGGTLALTGQVRVADLAGGTPDLQTPFAYEVPVSGGGYNALAAAHSRALELLGLEVARLLAGARS